MFITNFREGKRSVWSPLRCAAGAPKSKLAPPVRFLERVAGIEPARSAWEADRLPLHHTRVARGHCHSSSAVGNLYVALLQATPKDRGARARELAILRANNEVGTEFRAVVKG